jgi:uncharacterized protein
VSATPAVYRCVVGHARTRPVRHAFRYRTYLWLVDLDRLPHLPPPFGGLARFDPRDHFAGSAPTIRAGLERFLAARGVCIGNGTVLMLTHPRVFGRVFNPLTLYWCHGDDGALSCVVAEVHNTYGQRHCYLLGSEAQAEVRVVKEFYVSPFFPVDGDYRMRLPVPGERLDLTVQLERAGGRPFTATVRGERWATTRPELIAATVRQPARILGVAAAIRFQGIRLFARGLPVQPRPPHRPQEGLQ